MSHHFDREEFFRQGEPTERMNEIAERIKQQQAGLGLGATRRFPNGVVNDLDEGEIQFAIGSDPDRELVMINFGKSLDFLGMTPPQAIEMAQLLIQHARKVAKSPVTVQLH